MKLEKNPVLILLCLLSISSCQINERIKQSRNNWEYQVSGKVLKDDSDKIVFYLVEQKGFTNKQSEAWEIVHNFKPELKKGEKFKLTSTKVTGRCVVD